MKITEDGFKGIANMLKLSFTDKEERELLKDLNKEIDYIDTMNEMNTDGVEPITYIHTIENIYRDDIAINKSTKEGLHANAPEFVDGYYVVPRILD